jgi:hypothetical protein
VGLQALQTMQSSYILHPAAVNCYFSAPELTWRSGSCIDNAELSAGLFVLRECGFLQLRRWVTRVPGSDLDSAARLRKFQCIIAFMTFDKPVTAL